MTKSLKFLVVLVIGTGVLTFQSCKEDKDTPPEPNNTNNPALSCYITEQTESFPSSSTITYLYNDLNQVSNAIIGDDTTKFVYEDNKLISAYRGTESSEFIYEAGSSEIQRINQKENGTDQGYILVTNENGQIAKVETHTTTSGEDVTETITNITYVNGKITELTIEQYNPSTSAFETQFSLTSVETDDNINPLSSKVAYFFMNTQNPKAYGDNNIIKGTATIQGFPASYTAAIEYNTNNYPTAINASITNAAGTVPSNTSLTYNCK